MICISLIFFTPVNSENFAEAVDQQQGHSNRWKDVVLLKLARDYLQPRGDAFSIRDGTFNKRLADFTGVGDAASIFAEVYETAFSGIGYLLIVLKYSLIRLIADSPKESSSNSDNDFEDGTKTRR